MKRSGLLTPTLLAAALAVPAIAQEAQTGQGGSMSGMQHQSMPGMQMNMQNMNAAQKDLHAAMQKMNQEMMQGIMDADPGMAWRKSMAAHHKGATYPKSC